MQYVSPFSNPEVRAELTSDLSGLTIGSAFLLSTPVQAEAILKFCDDAAKAAFSKVLASGKPAEVECLTLDANAFIGFDCLKRTSDLPDDAVFTQIYRYFDTPRETIVTASIAAPSDLKKTTLVTLFCGPDRRKAGDYRIFSIHPGPRRQVFPNRYQPEAVRKKNREYWDRHIFLATPNQILAARRTMRFGIKAMEQETRDRVFHMTSQIDGALHRWYGTWEHFKRPEDGRGLATEPVEIGDYVMGPEGSVYYFMSKPGQPPPDLQNVEETESRLSNPKRPSIIRPDGGEEHFMEGKRHRENGPAVILPRPDGGWTEIWYEYGLVSRLPELGPARVVYNAKGEIEQETSVYRGSEVQETTLGPAAEPVKALQAQIVTVLKAFKWFDESQDFQLLRGQLEFAANRIKAPIDKVVRQMQQKDEQVGLRWDFDRTLEQDEYCRTNYDAIVKGVATLEELLLEAARAMRFVKGEASIVAAIWGKVMRDLDRVVERGLRIPGTPGKTVIDGFDSARVEAKKIYQTLAEQNKIFSATGNE